MRRGAGRKPRREMQDEWQGRLKGRAGRQGRPTGKDDREGRHGRTGRQSRMTRRDWQPESYPHTLLRTYQTFKTVNSIFRSIYSNPTFNSIAAPGSIFTVNLALIGQVGQLATSAMCKTLYPPILSIPISSWIMLCRRLCRTLCAGRGQDVGRTLCAGREQDVVCRTFC